MGTIERRAACRSPTLRALAAYWNGKRLGRAMPPRAAIHPEEMVPWLPNLMLLDVIGDLPRFRVRLFGTGLVHAYGGEITGRWMDECDLNSVTAQLVEQMIEVVRNGAPNVVHARYTKVHDGRYLDYERIALPLSADGKRVNMILCGYAIKYAVKMRASGDEVRI
jgi:hypothetical protein